MSGLVLIHDSAEATFWASHRTVNEGQFSDVVLVNHAEDGLLLDLVDNGILHLIEVGGRLLVEPIGGNELGRIVLRHSVNSVQRLGETGGGQAVDRRLKFSFLEDVVKYKLHHSQEVDKKLKVKSSNLQFSYLDSFCTLAQEPVSPRTSSLFQNNRVRSDVVKLTIESLSTKMVHLGLVVLIIQILFDIIYYQNK